jgi:hypothetical protein
VVPQTPRSPETPSYEELLERVVRLERLLLEKDRRIAELERLLEQSRRGGKRQASAPDLGRQGSGHGPAGPQLIATAAHINKVEGLSYGRVSGLLERLFGVTVSRSGLARSLGRLAERGGAEIGRVAERGRSPC